MSNLIDVIVNGSRGTPKIFLLTSLEVVMSGEVLEETFIIGALPILETLELNLTGLLFFSVVDAFSCVGNVAGINGAENVELKSPNNVGGVFDIAAFLEALERNGLSVILSVETAYDDESRIRVALKFLKLAYGIINAELGRFVGVRNDLEVVKANDGSGGFVGTKRFEKRNQIINGFVLKLQDAQIKP